MTPPRRLGAVVRPRRMAVISRTPHAHRVAPRGVAPWLAALTFGPWVAADPVPATVRFAWVRGTDADECPDASAMRADVTRRLRRDPFDESGPRSIEAVVERAPVGWRATLRVRDGDGSLLGERTLTHDATRCAPIADASALAIALAVDPDAVVEPASSTAPAPSSPPPRPRAPRRAPTPPGPSITVGLLGGFNVGINSWPTATVGVAAAVEAPSGWSARLRVDVAPGTSTSDGHFVFGFTRATVLGCGAPWRTPRMALSVCACVASTTLAVPHFMWRENRRGTPARKQQPAER